MSTKTLSNAAEPYARALFEIALTTDKLEVFLADMGGIYELFTQSSDLTDYLNSPIYPLKTKKDGRWWIGLYSVETDYVKNRRTAKPVSK